MLAKNLGQSKVEHSLRWSLVVHVMGECYDAA